MDFSKVKPRFDDVLQSHFERLIGTRVGIRGLPISLETITALVLLAERAGEGQADPSKYHTKESLCGEMEEVGLESKEGVQAALIQLEEKAYISVLDSGNLESLADVNTMTTALDKVFPQMPGMLLVAYYVQTLLEVVTGRKEPDHAVDQFDQALTMHGASAKRSKQPDDKSVKKKVDDSVAKKRLDSLRKLTAARSAATRKKQAAAYSMADLGDPKPMDALPQSETTSFEAEAVSVPPVAQGTLVSDQDPLAHVQEEVQEPNEIQAQLHIEEDSSLAPKGISEEQESEQVSDQDTPTEGLSAEPDSGEGEPPLSSDTVDQDMDKELSPEDQEDASPEPQVQEEVEDDAISQDGVSPEATSQPVPFPDVEPEAATSIAEEVTPPSPQDVVDADVMERVAEFEEALAMACPLCGEGKVKDQQTSMGKIFYVCTEQACQFISWGKPHHIACPQCGNTFLVEGAAIEGAAILKCPRATCNHAQPVGGESVSGDAGPKKKKKRRVVRRRVAKRK